MIHPFQNSATKYLAVAPLGAGDLIERAVKFYRLNFWMVVWIIVPMINAGMPISTGWTITEREPLISARRASR